MGKNWFLALTISLASFCMAPIRFGSAAGPLPGTDEAGLTQRAAQAWVDKVAASSRDADWKGALVTAPQPLADLGDAVTAYLFSIVGSKGVTGYILVGSSSYAYDVFEAGHDAPSALFSICVRESLIEYPVG